MSSTDRTEASATAPSRRTRVESGIYKRADGKLEIGWRDAQGKQRWKVVDGGIKPARAALATEHARRGRREKVAADPRLRFGDAADKWWDARVTRLRPGTQSAYGCALVHLRAAFGNWRLSDIEPKSIAEYVERQRAAGLKGWSVRGHMTVLGSVYKYSARHLGYVGGNPVALLDRIERPSTDDAKRKRILSGEELSALVAAVAPRHQLIFEFAGQTGARIGEVLGMTWEHVDFDGGSVHIVVQLDRSGHLVDLKTKRSKRWLEITPSLVRKLREHKLASARSGPHDLVFVSREGTAHDHRNIGGRVLARAVERAGLGAIERDGEVIVTAPTFHDLRHSHASALIAAGWDLQEISDRLGHADSATTMRTYLHEFDAVRRSDERRGRLTAMYGADPVEAGMEATASGSDRQNPVAQVGNVAYLPQKTA